MKRYGKSADGILSVKQSFFGENSAHLQAALRHAQLYVQQPLRLRCKLCDTLLPSEPDFIKLGVPYASCQECHHLNGLHEDTTEFCRVVYLDEDYGAYYRNTSKEEFNNRVRSVYRPKVDFLIEALSAQGSVPAELSYVDIGAGSGHLVAAMLDAGLERCQGLELSPSQVAYGNLMMGEARLQAVSLSNSVRIARETDATVVSLIGVLEHLQELRTVLRALRENPIPQYIFLCVPLFGLCVFFEMVFPQVYPRHLVSDHTHLFTEKSILWMEKEFGFQRCAEWWFGSDMLDLFRHMSVAISQKDTTKGMTASWEQAMRPLIDPLQLAIDQRHLNSEVHLLLRIKR